MLEYYHYLFAIFIIVIIINIIIRKKRLKIVKEKSKVYSALIELNRKTKFNHLRKELFYSKRFFKKYKFDTTTPSEFLYQKVKSNKYQFKAIIDKANSNIIKYNKYCDKYENLSKLVGETDVKEVNIKNNTFIKIEKKLYNNMKLEKPRTDFNVNLTLRYSSPKGRNSYSKDAYAVKENLISLLEDIKKEEDYRKSKEYFVKDQRRKLTNGLRYDILKRDNFHCQICGSSQEDGVKLHVDHIKPVSKGGKTKRNNLRTLCDRCNLGKSNKIEKQINQDGKKQDEEIDFNDKIDYEERPSWTCKCGYQNPLYAKRCLSCLEKK